MKLDLGPMTVAVKDISPGAAFTKRQGDLVHRRAFSLKHSGLEPEPGKVYALDTRGRMVVFEPDTKVCPLVNGEKFNSLQDLVSKSSQYRQQASGICVKANRAEHLVRALLAAGNEVHVTSLELGSWDCAQSPTGFCYYNTDNDPCRDYCLVCGGPDERK
jgi:hypothetical protein